MLQHRSGAYRSFSPEPCAVADTGSLRQNFHLSIGESVMQVCRYFLMLATRFNNLISRLQPFHDISHILSELQGKLTGSSSYKTSIMHKFLHKLLKSFLEELSQHVNLRAPVSLPSICFILITCQPEKCEDYGRKVVAGAHQAKV